MTPPPPPSVSGPATTPAARWAVWGLIMGIVALKVFAARASGSVGALTALTDSLIDLMALALIAGAGRSRTLEGEAGLRRIKGSMAVAAGVFMGLICLWRIGHPQALSGGLWAPTAALGVLGLTLVLARLRAREVADGAPETRGAARDQSIAETAAAGVLLLGLVAGVLLGVPALDAAAGLILAIWMGWGGWALIRSASGHEAGVGPALTPGMPPARRGPWG